MGDGASESETPTFLAGGGEMGERVRAFDWSTTPVGPIEGWSQGLRTIVQTMLCSRYAMWMGWGPEFTFFYNDAYARMTLGPKHPWALGRPARIVWSEIWGDVGPRAESVLRTGEATWDEGLLLFLERNGFPEETYHTFSYSPVPDDAGGVGGMLCVVTEDTARTIGERRLRTLRDTAARTTDAATTAEEACRTSAAILASSPRDLPFALLYVLDDEGGRALLAGTTGVAEDLPISPPAIDLAEDDGAWPFREVATAGTGVLVEDLEDRFGVVAAGAWPDPLSRAVVLPLAKPGQTQPAGFLVAGLSPRLAWDEAYRDFLELLASQIASAIASARAYEEERRRAQALAELDRAKTTFFSNISHEFRTPLTLMLGPVEDWLSEGNGDLPPAARERLELVRRNGRRLLRLVNSLLDFSRIEAGRARAVYRPTDLSAFTAELASVFRSACERAGLRLTVDCPALPEPAFVDREMWETIVLNLLSNAFKFTLEGEIALRMREIDGRAELRVRDTGIGVAAEEMPRLFERFHRIENSGGRTHEGSGIGLALVQELVKLHGGSVAAESALGEGTTFVVSLPLGSSHLPPDRIGEEGGAASPRARADAFIEEALRWLPDDATARDESRGEDDLDPVAARFEDSTLGATGPANERPRVFVVDDNADMRGYIARLLADRYRIEAFDDGETALTAARERAPDLVLSDVMMPRLDGFGLLRALRDDPRTARAPVILLSARAGEESRVEGMEAGADDYLVKPFSARELLARVGAHLQIAQARRESERALQAERDLLSVTLASIGDAVITTDTDGAVVNMNPVAEALTGWSVADAAGEPLENVFRIVNETTRMRVESPAARALREGVIVGLANHTILLGRDGVERPIDDSAAPIRNAEGNIIGCVLVFRDITERKQAEAALRESEKRFREFANTAPAMLWVTEADGMCSFLSRGWYEFTGQTESEGLGLGWLDAVHADDRDRTRDEFLAANAERRPFAHEHRIRKADGAYRWALDAGRSRFDAEGRFLGYIGAVIDIDERKQAEDELRRVAAELSEGNRRKTEFLATLGHELRNPMAPIRTGLELLRTETDPEEREATRATMERQARQMVRLIDDLLDVSRITQGKLKLLTCRVRLAEVIGSAVEATRPFLDEAGHALVVELPREPVELEADPSRLAQVFSNLLNNAAKYTPDGGRIAVAAIREGDEVVVTVTDDGIGVPPEMQRAIFEMFSQIDRPIEKGYKGLGIGLTLVKRLVEMHGGTIAVRSEGEGRGSQFSVRLPISNPATPLAPREVAPHAGAATTKRLRVLVVDDNKTAADMLGRVVKMLGNEVRVAYDGTQGVEAAEAFRPEVVLMDLGMPRMNGYEAAHAIRQRPWGSSVMLVALTGWGQDEDRRRTRDAGFDRHLVKPAEPSALQQVLAEAAARDVP